MPALYLHQYGIPQAHEIPELYDRVPARGPLVVSHFIWRDSRALECRQAQRAAGLGGRIALGERCRILRACGIDF